MFQNGKRGQIAIVVVIVLILAFGVFLYFQLQHDETTSIVKEEKTLETIEQSGKANLQVFIDSCFEKSITRAVYLVFAQGGYYHLPSDIPLFSFEQEGEQKQLPYYFYSTQQTIPSLALIETETERATSDYLKDCIGDFSSFQEQGFVIEQKEPSVAITFGTKSMHATLDFPITMSRGDQTLQLQQFVKKIDIAVPDKHTLVQTYFQKQQADPSSFLVGEWATLAFQYQTLWAFKQFQDDGSDIVIDLIFEQVFKEPLIWSFASHYTWQTIQEPQTAEIQNEFGVTMDDDLVWDVIQAGTATYKIKAEGEDLTFETDTQDYQLDAKTGVITLNQPNFDNGEYLYYIKVSDTYGDEVIRPFYVNVKVPKPGMPSLTPIRTQHLKIGESFSYDIVGQGGKFSLETPFPDMKINSETGQITFTPTKEDEGIYSVRVNIENNKGLMWERFDVVIEP